MPAQDMTGAPLLPLQPSPFACPAVPEPRPLPEQIVTDWAPPGIAGPWPHDEYLCDGGDKMPDATVDAQWNVHGLEIEDTVAHFDTLDGRTLLTPSNRVCLYSPRFASVRRVAGVELDQQNERLEGAIADAALAVDGHRDAVESHMQPVQAIGDEGVKGLMAQKQTQFAPQLKDQARLAAVYGGFLPFEDFCVIRSGVYDASEKARLANAFQNAIAWSDNLAVQVLLDKVEAIVASGDQRVQATFTVDLPKHPKLRLIKIASTNTARSGEDVDFTIRFDNVGDQTIGNVVILDHLTPRLEYVPDSAKCSRDGEFSAEPGGNDTLVLRWEMNDPLAPGDGGVVRFHCTVR